MKKFTVKLIILCISLTAQTLCSSVSGADGQLTDQLVINRAMLLSGTDQGIRVVAAKQLLLDMSEPAKGSVIEILAMADNENAISAICIAIDQSSGWDVPMALPDVYIKPLIGVLGHPNVEVAKHAAVALSSYPYEAVKLEIENVLYSGEISQQTRLNAIYAIGLRLSEKDAIGAMISLLDDKDTAIADQACKTLQGWVPIGANKALWNYVRTELKQKSPDEIVRDRLSSQETKVQQLQQQNKVITDELVSIYEQLYAVRIDLPARSALLIDALKKPIVEVRLWAVRKIVLWRNANDLPNELAAAAVEVISDPDQTVRLETAKLMVYMAGVNPADKLMAQLQIEEIEQVQSSLLEALAESCYYSLLPASSLKLDPKVRIFTLTKAGEFLNAKTPEHAILGAEVTRKLLEKNGLEDEVVEGYVGAVLKRYKSASDNNPPLAARILGVLSRFCLPDFHYRAIGKKLLEQEFVAALISPTVETRKAAAAGLINIDKANALKTLREKQLYNDPDPTVVAIIIALAKEVGNGGDYIWLVEKNKQNVEGVWGAIVSILQREDVATVEKAINSIDTFNIDDARKIEILEIGRKKAGIKYKSSILLAQFYLSRSKNTEAAELYASLLLDPAGKSSVVQDASNAINALVSGVKTESVVLLVTELLAAGDIKPEDPIGSKLIEAAAAEGGEALKAELLKIVPPEPRAGWQQIVAVWKPAAPVVPAPEAAKPAAIPAAAPAPAPTPAPAPAANPQ